jgi:Sec-independent protein translocase protein TatA
MYYLLVAKVAKKVPVSFFNPWMIASIVELLIILILIILLFKKKKKKPDDFYVGESIKEYKDAEVDFGNMFNSMFNASTLHDALKKKIHPDRFPNDEEKIKIANELTTQLNESKNNIAKMREIQAMATEKLGITF